MARHDFAIGGVNFRFGKGAPLVAAVGGVNLGRDVFVEAGVGEQPRLDDVRIVFGNVVGELGNGNRLQRVEVGR